MVITTGMERLLLLWLSTFVIKFTNSAIVPPPWANPTSNPCATQPRGWQLLYWPADGKCYKIFQIGAPCPETMELSPATDGTTAECRCPPGTAQSPRDALCHPIFTRASCPKGQYFAPVPESSGKASSKKRWGVCREPEPCNSSNEIFWPRDAKCYARHTRGPCPKGELLTLDKDGLATCSCTRDGLLGKFYSPIGGGCYDKNLNIDEPKQLRGLKSCHTGVGRNVGYKIPLTKLSKMGILTDLNNPEYSSRENELRALNSFFSKACLVGTWSPDPAINQRLKETYSNLCALCEKPEVCDYPDLYSGYEGALRCLAQNSGDVAWTKVIYVRRFFGLIPNSNDETSTPSTTTKVNPEDYRYFCPDGTKVLIDQDTKPCTWAARPWQGYMTNGGVADIDAVQKELTQLGKFGEERKANWWKHLMLLNEKTLAVPTSPIDPQQHLKVAKYVDVIERNFGAPERDARWCIYTTKALEKCRALSKAAFSRDARPRFDCILEKDEDACLKALRDDRADLLVLSGERVESAMKNYNVKPIVAEAYGAGATEFSERPAVAVIKRGSYIKSLRHLKGKNSCHSGYKDDFAGWIAPIHAMKNVHLINSEEDMAEFFIKSCVPGAQKNSSLCSLCIGNLASKDENLAEMTKCSSTEAEDYKGGRGALKCLLDEKGQVAFIPLTALEQENTTKASDFNLVCPNGGIARIDDWQRCNFGLEPPRIVVSFAGKSANSLEELTHGLLAASSLYSKNPDWFRLFGSWGTQSNVLFKDESINLISIDNSWNQWKQWAAVQRDYDY